MDLPVRRERAAPGVGVRSLNVYILMGWFGDQEWIEGVYLDVEKAQKQSEKLWETRSSDLTPDNLKGVAKFGIDGYKVIDAS